MLMQHEHHTDTVYSYIQYDNIIQPHCYETSSAQYYWKHVLLPKQADLGCIRLYCTHTLLIPADLHRSNTLISKHEHCPSVSHINFACRAWLVNLQGLKPPIVLTVLLEWCSYYNYLATSLHHRAMNTFQLLPHSTANLHKIAVSEATLGNKTCDCFWLYF